MIFVSSASRNADQRSSPKRTSSHGCMERARQLLRWYPASLVNFIVFTDEKLFTVARPTNAQNDRVYARHDTLKKQVQPLDCCVRVPHSAALWWCPLHGLSALGRTLDKCSLCEAWRESKWAVYYRDVLLMQGLLPDIRELSEFYIFQRDSTPAHRARETVELLTSFHPHSGHQIALIQWTTKSGQLSKKRFIIAELKTFMSCASASKQRGKNWTSAYAVRQWRTRLHACVKAKGDHFEHKLHWLNNEMPDKLFNRSILTIGFYCDFRISDQMRR